MAELYQECAGKVYEDIYKEQRAIEDKTELYEITREVQKDISKISSDVSKNTDLEFAHKTFGDLVKPEKYDFHVTSQDAKHWASKIKKEIM